MDSFFWIVVLVAVTVIISSFNYWMFWISLSFMRLRPIRTRVLTEDEVPQSLRQAAADIERQLLDLGFAYRGGMASSSVTYDLPEECLALIFFHPERQAIATITETPYPGSLRPFEVTFHNLLPHGRALHTSDCYAHQMFALSEEFIGQDGYFADLEQQWRLHNQRLNFNPSAVDAWSPLELDASDLEYLVQWFQRSAECFFDFWLSSRKILRLARDVYFPNPFYVARFTSGWVNGQKQAFAAMQKKSAVDIGGRYFLERQLAFRRSSNAISKILLLVFSLVGFYLAFGLMLSWSLVPLLIVVLLVHEYGHYWAMRYFGYRDTQIFFVPFLGAAATGIKADPKLWQEIVVYLAGPVPGIVIGLALLWSPWVETWKWLHEFALLCLALNIINLLPLMPLDGGRIVERLVFVRYAGARLWFCGVSAACFASGAWYTRDLVLIFLAVVTGFMAWGEWHKRPLLKKIRHRLADTTHEQGDERKTRVVDVLFEEPLPPALRLNMARELLVHIKDRPAAAHAMLVGMLMYAFLLGGSLVAAGQVIISANMFGDEDYYSADFWRETVAAEKEIDGIGWRATLSAIESIRSGSDPEDAEEFIVRAEELVAKWREPDLRLAQWRLLKPILTDVLLVEQDVNYVRDNILRDQHADAFERVRTLLRLLDAPTLLDDKDKLGLVEDALSIHQEDPEFGELFAPNLYFRKGTLQQSLGQEDMALLSFEQGLVLEQASEYPLYQDSNYSALLDLYFVRGKYRQALAISEQRLAALGENSESLSEEYDEYQQESFEKVHQQQAWFLLLTGNSTASESFAALLQGHKPNPDKSGYNKKMVEFLLDTLYSHQQQGLETASLVKRLSELPEEHTSRFIKGCNCGKRGPFDTYRHERYLELMRELGFSEAP